MLNTEKLAQISIESEMKKSYLDYAMSVIIGRALPEVRDGLKPVHRRILFAMRELKNDWNKAYKKSARIVGDVIGKYHPHGDTAVYDTIVRMAQDFSLRYPLIDGQGNFGSVDGDRPAAMRYTEIRMARMAHKMMEDLDKETVEFTPNYDDSLTEPSVLPAKAPNLLINGSAGIAVGMATNIPPHNLFEVIEATKAIIDNPDLTLQDLMQHITGPDFPTAGIIYGTTGIHDAYKTGRGIIRVRARAVIEKDKRTGRETIVVTELPYQVNKAKLIEKIAILIRGKQIEGVRYIRDESDREGMRIAVGLKKNQFAEVIINKLYKHTRMENTFGIIFLAIVNNQPKQLSLKKILEHFILHRREIIIRRTRYDLKKAEARAHILEGLKIALENIDDVIFLIRESKSPGQAKKGLVRTYELTVIQAQAILDMRLQRLTGLEQEKILEEYKNILKDIAWYQEILSSERIVKNIIKEELTEIEQEYGDERRTEIVESTKEITIEDMIVEEDMVVTISKSGYIKRNPITLYRKIPQAGRMSRGKAIVNLLNLGKDEKLTTVLDVPAFEPGYYVIMATRSGLVKKTDLMAFSRPRSGGIIALSLVPGDELIVARITDGTQNVFLGSTMGKSIRFHESDVRPSGRVARGVRGLSLGKDDRVVGMEVLSHGQKLFTATENGYGKRTSIDEYPLQKRGGKGVITIKTSERNGQVVAILLVDDEDDLMLMADTGKLIRMSVSQISVISRNTQGVKLIGLLSEERVSGVARLAEKEDHL